jgi:hypothetical protein
MRSTPPYLLGLIATLAGRVLRAQFSDYQKGFTYESWGGFFSGGETAPFSFLNRSLLLKPQRMG